MKKYTLAIAFIGSLFLISCGNNTADNKEKTSAAPVVAEDTPETEVKIDADDKMMFSRKKIIVPAGKEVTITLNHTGTMPITTMGHNIVILKAGEDIVAYAGVAASAKEENYVPKSEASKVIAASSLIGGGESTTLKFTIAEPGEYPFICSFPGHYGMMKGVIIVK